MKNIDTRPSAIAGTWYPGEPNQLRPMVEQFLQTAGKVDFEEEVLGVIAPHAGYQYSGSVAGHAFAALRGAQPEIVAVISPLHVPYPYPFCTTSHHAYQTPLGTIPVDIAAVKDFDDLLENHLGIRMAHIARDKEHSLEIELPFLQVGLPGKFSLLPIMVNAQQADILQQVGTLLGKELNSRKAVLVASTDLSHFYPQPVAQQLDREMLRRFSAFDPPGILLAEVEGKAFACGKSAVALTLWAASEMGASRVQILNYATSGEVTGDFTSVVGYGAAAILKSKI